MKSNWILSVYYKIYLHHCGGLYDVFHNMHCGCFVYLSEVRRMDCYNWYVTGHKKGKYRRTYSYIKEEDGNISHRLLRYTYDYAWESMPGLRVIHYIPGDPRHQVQCVGKKPNFEVCVWH